MTIERRRGDGTREIGPTWESLVEREIREAMEAGAFRDLPHQGRRLPLDDDTAAGDRALGFRILRNAGVAPPWIEADKEVRALLERRAALLAQAARSGPLARPTVRQAFREVVEALDGAVARLNAEAPTDRQHRRPLDLEAELAALERAFPPD